MTESTKFQLIINAEDEDELKIYIHANATNSLLWEFNNFLRSFYKHGPEENIKTPQQAIEHIRDRFNDLLGENIL